VLLWEEVELVVMGVKEETILNEHLDNLGKLGNLGEPLQ
jgi:hypothetical protein